MRKLFFHTLTLHLHPTIQRNLVLERRARTIQLSRRYQLIKDLTTDKRRSALLLLLYCAAVRPVKTSLFFNYRRNESNRSLFFTLLTNHSSSLFSLFDLSDGLTFLKSRIFLMTKNFINDSLSKCSMISIFRLFLITLRLMHSLVLLKRF